MKKNILIRNHDFVSSCRRRARELADEGTLASTDEIIDYVLGHEAPSYYTGFDYARRVLHHYLRRGRLPQSEEPYREKWLAMAADLRAELLRDPSRHPDDVICALCDGELGSPRFFLSRRRARWLLRQAHRAARSRRF